jgi:hypothetical protein
VLSEDLPGERWENRWRLELMLDGPQACVVPQRLGGTWIRVSATSRGSYTIDVAGWGLIEITPGDPELRAAFRRAAPGSESRWQTMTLAHSGDGLRLLIEELR